MNFTSTVVISAISAVNIRERGRNGNLDSQIIESSTGPTEMYVAGVAKCQDGILEMTETR